MTSTKSVSRFVMIALAVAPGMAPGVSADEDEAPSIPTEDLERCPQNPQHCRAMLGGAFANLFQTINDTLPGKAP